MTTPTFLDKFHKFLRRVTQIEMAEISKAGRVYEPGKATADDLKQKIIQDIVEHGGNFITGFFLGKNSGNHKPNLNVTYFAKQPPNLFHHVVFCLIYTGNFGETSGKETSGKVASTFHSVS